MKKMLLLTAGAIVVVQVAKYFGINSMEDAKKILMPQLKKLVLT